MDSVLETRLCVLVTEDSLLQSGRDDLIILSRCSDYPEKKVEFLGTGF